MGFCAKCRPVSAHCERNEVRDAWSRAGCLLQRKERMQQWADYLDKIKAGVDVIPMRANLPRIVLCNRLGYSAR